MSVLTSDYERLQSPDSNDEELVKQYRTLFNNQNIAGAQALINQDNAYLVMNASKLNDLVDTINYMQQFWADDKEQFVDWYMGMTESLEVYDSTATYHTGSLVLYDNLPYFCIVDDTTGAWDSSKWILLKPNETGVNFSERTVHPNINDMVWRNENNIIIWSYYDGGLDAYLRVAQTYPNIRYLSDTTQAINNEVYITDYSEGV